MTQCNKQFDPLKPCEKRNKDSIDYLKIDLSEPKGKYIQAWKRVGDDQKFFGSHYPCGHYWETHHDNDDDLINVEEESENISPLEKEHLRKRASDCSNAIHNLMKQLLNLRQVLDDLSH